MTRNKHHINNCERVILVSARFDGKPDDTSGMGDIVQRPITGKYFMAERSDSFGILWRLQDAFRSVFQSIRHSNRRESVLVSASNRQFKISQSRFTPASTIFLTSVTCPVLSTPFQFEHNDAVRRQGVGEAGFDAAHRCGDGIHVPGLGDGIGIIQISSQRDCTGGGRE